MSDRLAQLSAAGVAVWLDDISRGRLARYDQPVISVGRGKSTVTTCVPVAPLSASTAS